MDGQQDKIVKFHFDGGFHLKVQSRLFEYYSRWNTNTCKYRSSTEQTGTLTVELAANQTIVFTYRKDGSVK